MDTKALTAQIPLPLAEKLDALAARLTQEALAELDAGRLVDHHHVREWANSLGTAKPKPVPLSR